jgi:hypothetical protein
MDVPESNPIHLDWDLLFRADMWGWGSTLET